MDKELVDFALNYAADKEVEYAEVRAQNDKSEGLVMKNGVLDAYFSAVDSGFCVRILAEGGIGFASTNRWNKEEAKKIVEIAYKLAKMAMRRDKISFAKEKSVKVKWKVDERKKIEDISPEERIETFAEMDKELTSQGISVPGRMFSSGTSLSEKYFINTEGSVISSYVPRVSAYGFITVVENGKSEQAYKQFGYAGGWEALDQWKLTEQMIYEARVLQGVIREAKAVKPGKMDLVCGPEVTGIAAHESCGHPMEADRILGREMSQAGMSFIYPHGHFWLGTKIGSPLVTIIDDPTIKNSYGYYEYDDEGIKARPRYLYKNGVINEFLHNRESAAKLNTRSNGSSRTISYDREAIVRMANTFVEAGDIEEEELFEDVKQGVYMKSFTEWNIDDKRFNQRYVGREAYWIENGKLKHRIARPVIETSTQIFWSAVDAVSKKVEYDAATCGKGDPQQGIPVYTGGPAIRLKGVHVK
ncbi:MAG: TldD/PmbA family protein [Candidatus Bathyarchaeia archaeon]